MHDTAFYFDEVELDQQWLSAERVVSEADILTFADLTGDNNPVHTDSEFARTTPFRRCIAHGLLGLSLASGLNVQAPYMRTLAFLGMREWHFRAPVFPGDVLRVRSRVLEKEGQSRNRRGIITWEIQVLNQDGRVVQEGVTRTLVEGRVYCTARHSVLGDSARAAETLSRESQPS